MQREICTLASVDWIIRVWMVHGAAKLADSSLRCAPIGMTAGKVNDLDICQVNPGPLDSSFRVNHGAGRHSNGKKPGNPSYVIDNVVVCSLGAPYWERRTPVRPVNEPPRPPSGGRAWYAVTHVRNTRERHTGSTTLGAPYPSLSRIIIRGAAHSPSTTVS
jgi:hypothetical protein